MHHPRAMLAAALGGLLSLLSSSDQAKKTPYVVLPVHSEKPPPQDPTLLRLTKSLAVAVQRAVKEDVRVATREERDQRCPQEDGVCPNDIARFVDAERAISFALNNTFDTLTVRVYRDKYGVEREAKLPCQWNEGAVSCDVEKLPALFDEASGPGALKNGEVLAEFGKLEKQLDKCRKLDKGQPDPPQAWISFSVRPDGHVHNVRIDPRELQERPGFACIATTVESMRVRKFSGADQSFRVSLLKKEPHPKKGKK